jgi:TPR repeat protein
MKKKIITLLLLFLFLTACFVIFNVYASNSINLKTLKSRASLGDAKAEFALGKLYFHGRGVSKDYTKALYWLKKSSAQGNFKAKQFLKKIDDR